MRYRPGFLLIYEDEHAKIQIAFQAYGALDGVFSSCTDRIFALVQKDGVAQSL
jgi:hypothetical protein